MLKDNIGVGTVKYSPLLNHFSRGEGVKKMFGALCVPFLILFNLFLKLLYLKVDKFEDSSLEM